MAKELVRNMGTYSITDVMLQLEGGSPGELSVYLGSGMYPEKERIFKGWSPESILEEFPNGEFEIKNRKGKVKYISYGFGELLSFDEYVSLGRPKKITVKKVFTPEPG